MARQTCAFFLRGQCKFGASCKNDHPQDGQRQGGFGNQSWTNRTSNTREKLPLPFSTDAMTNDLTPQVDKPIWPLSSYGAAKHEPTLISGLDESPEELRLRAVVALQAGNINEYLKYESDKIIAAEQIYANARNNISQAYDQAVKQSSLPALLTGSSTGTTRPTFSTGPSTSSTSAFGNLSNTPSAPSAFGTSSTSTFGKPAFGQPTFGQSAFGQTATPAASTSAFSPPSSTSAFGQPQQTSAFGQTSPPQPSLIKPATGAFSSLSNTGTSAFGSGGFSAFAGQPSAFGLGAGPSTSAPQTTGGSVFGQSSFGTPAAQTQTSVFGTPAPAQTAFGASAPPSVFGQQQGPVSAFGGSAFSTNPNPQPGSGSVFGAGDGTSGSSFSSNTNQTSTPFAPQTNQPISAFAPIQNQTPSVFGTSSQPLSAFASQIKPPPAGPPDFLNAKSTYRPGLTPYDQLPDNYINLIPPAAMEAFKSQRFEWGKVPDWIPPKELR